MQVTLRQNVGSLLWGVNYVLSKSIDNGSSGENIGSNVTGEIPNAFATGAARSVSAFDIRHNFNAHFVADLPFGRGKKYGSAWNAATNAVLGDWAITGISRAYSGLPVRVANGLGRSTDAQLGGPGVELTPVQTGINRNGPDGYPNIFANTTAAFASFGAPGPGGVGTQYPFYGPAYFVVDLGVSKQFHLPKWDRQRLEFRATAFNALNKANFLYTQVAAGFTAGFGDITSTVGPRGGAREMEFALRYQF
jgi:hypothetical protein